VFKYCIGILVGVLLHIALLDAAEVVEAKRVIRCSDGNSKACFEMVFRFKTPLEKAAWFRFHFGQRMLSKHMEKKHEQKE